MKKLIVVAAILAGDLTANEVRADGCPGGPFCRKGGHLGLFGAAFAQQPVPAFQAAPWYLYWPYNAHFQTPAPLAGAFYAPPYAGGYLVNPYFPAANYPAYPGAPIAVPPPGAPPAPLPDTVAPTPKTTR